jgi:hypothetical protein
MERVMNRAVLTAAAAGATLLVASTTTIAAPSAGGANNGGASAEHARIVAHWTPERRAAAIPRDLVIDERGLGYLRRPDGALQPYGHTIAATAQNSPTPMARPGGDATAPTISGLDPASGATIGAAYTFKATVTDASGLRSVSFRVGPQGGQQQSFNASAGANNVYSVNLSGFTNGPWTWSVVAKDKANNTATTEPRSFTVSTSGGGGGGGSVVTNSPWTASSTVREAAGRIYFEMPSNSRRTRWAGYVCSGTVVSDGTGGRSVIQTAAHCVYDDAYKAFARNVLFIPNQQASGTATDTSCTNDLYGCWAPNFGVVDVDWTTRTFPDNVTWDYAYYVVNDANGHSGNGGGVALVLDATVGSLGVSFGTPTPPNSGDARTHALGYSYSEDPNFMYCAEPLTSLDSANWWLGSCGLSGGASGGPWMLPFDGGNGTLISVNSWGYTNQPGMAGPKMNTTSAACVFASAKAGALLTTQPADGDAGYKPDCP